MKSLTSIAFSLFVAVPSYGALLKSEPGDKKVENVILAKSATASIEGKSLNFTLLGAGLRTKKVLFVHVKVYVAELFSTEASGFQRSDSEALNSLDLAPAVAVRLNFLRSVDAEKVQNSFKDALAANKIDVKDPAIESFLKAIAAGGEAHEGKSMAAVLQKNADGSETLFFEDSNEKITKVNGNKGFIRNVLSIWLGQPADDGVAKLKESILKGI